MRDPFALILKHRTKGVLIDANLLVLFLVGTVNRRRILTFKRTRAFTPEDFDVLARFLEWFGKVIVTPHVLSQASDLTALRGDELSIIRQLFKFLVEHSLQETYDPASTLVSDPVFVPFGLADAAIATISARETLVLTTDWNLQGALEKRGRDSLHFDVARTLASLVSRI